MQLGNLVVGTVAGLLVALDRRRPRRRHRRVARHGAQARRRAGRPQRRWPTTSRSVSDRGPARSTQSCGGDVPSSGPSFPSGHVILVAGDRMCRRRQPAVRLVVGSDHPHAVGDVRPGLRRRPQPARRRSRTRRRPGPRRRHRDTCQLTLSSRGVVEQPHPGVAPLARLFRRPVARRLVTASSAGRSRNHCAMPGMRSSKSPG